MKTSRKSLGWTIEYSKAAERLLSKMPADAQRRIIDSLEEIIVTGQDPYSEGKALQGSAKGRWRYRMGDYRVICQIENERVTVLVLTVGHRREVYR